VTIALDEARVPPADPNAEPEGFVVSVGGADRIHFLDWGGPVDAAPGVSEAPEVVLVHGLGGTAWAWTPVARRLRAIRRVVGIDLRGHGLSDAPTHGYDPPTLAEDVIAVAEGAAQMGAGATTEDETRTGDETRVERVVVAGHGFGAIVAAWAAVALGDRCAGLVLVDGGWEELRASTGIEPDEFLRTIEEPPAIFRSMAAYLADRAAFDPTTWDADQEHAARATVVEVPAGRVVPSTRPHALAASVEAMFEYRPVETLGAVTAPILALVAGTDETGTREATLAAVVRARASAGRSPIEIVRYPFDGHNLMRYRPASVAAAILALG
jgi:pimeloyl-ACP methyl ester carboxylesterase